MAQICAGRMCFGLTGSIFRNKRWFVLEVFRLLVTMISQTAKCASVTQEKENQAVWEQRRVRLFCYPQMTQMAQICAGRMCFGLTGSIFRNKSWFVLEVFRLLVTMISQTAKYVSVTQEKENQAVWEQRRVRLFYYPQMTQMAQICAGRMYFGLRVRYSEIKVGSFWRFLDCWLPWFHRLRSVLPWLKKKKIKPFESSVEWDFFVIHRWRRWRRYVPVVCISALRVRYSEIKVGSFWRFLDG